MITVHPTSWLRTSSWLTTARALPNVSEVFTGEKAVTATISPAGMASFSRVTLTSGFEFFVHESAQVLTYGSDQYYWKSLAELKPGSRICAGTNFGNRRFMPTYCSTSYWIGALFLAGRFDGTAIRLRVGKNAPEVRTDWLTNSFSTSIIRDGDVLTFSKPNKKKVIDKLGDWDHSTCMMIGVPLPTMVSSTKQRRMFCKGVIDNCEDTNDRVWEVPLGTKARAHDFYRVLRSCNVNSMILKNFTITVPKWFASLELDTPTPYPSDDEIFSEGVTAEALVDLERAASIRFTNINNISKSSKSSARLFGSVLYCKHVEDKMRPIHPFALRAAMRSLSVQTSSPIYDSAYVENVEPLAEKSESINVDVNSLEVDGYIMK